MMYRVGESCSLNVATSVPKVGITTHMQTFLAFGMRNTAAIVWES